jgi:DnaJ-class molecular chaperone
VSSEKIEHPAAGDLTVCPDCRGGGWRTTPETSTIEQRERCARCAGTGYLGLKESIVEAGGAS